MASVSDFFLNKGTSAEQQVVDAPAFSLTKVLAAGAVIITPIATVIIEALEEKTGFRAPHYVALAIGLLGFLAITATADVLARALVTSAKKRTEAAQKESDAARVHLATSAARLLPFDEPVRASQVLPGADAPVEVLAAAIADDPYFLVKGKDDKITWVPAKEVRLGAE